MDPNVKTACGVITRQQHKMVDELEQAVVRLGGDPRHGGLAGNNRLLWSASDHLDEPSSFVVGGWLEAAQREVYLRALHADLPLNVHMLVQRQHIEISAIRERARQLEQAQLEQAGGSVNTRLSRSVPRVNTWFDF